MLESFLHVFRFCVEKELSTFLGFHDSNNQTWKRALAPFSFELIQNRHFFSKMATTREPAIPAEDEREILSKGIPGIDSAIAKQPVLGSYLPVNPVNRYTLHKWDQGDWNRHNENKYFQANRDRDRAIT